MAVRRPRSMRGEGQQLRGELLNAGHRLLDRTGDPRSVTIRAVVGMAGVAPPALYRHFPGRRAFLLALASDRFSLLPSHLAEAADHARDAPLEQLHLGLAAFVSFAVQNPGHYRALFEDVARCDDPVEWRALEAFEHFIEASYAPATSDAGVLRQLTTSLVAFAHGYIQLTLSGRRGAPLAALDVLEALDALCALSPGEH